MSLRAAYKAATTDDSQRLRETTGGWTYPSDQPMRACNCIGPQDGNPVCPCRMGSLKIRDGRWVEIIDHGPAKS